MPPIKLSRSERASLQKIAERPRQAGEIPSDHEEKFINYELIRRHVLLHYITPLGQMELLRQRFRGIRIPTDHLSQENEIKQPFLLGGFAE